MAKITNMRFLRFSILAGLPLLGAAAQASTFFDDFNSGPSPLWNNQRGSWFGNAGTYDAQFPSNSPTTYSDLSYSLGDFSVDVDVNKLQDGGIWLRSSFGGGSESGVLLVTGGFGGSGTGLYWHTVQSGSYSGAINSVGGLFISGFSNAHIRVTVSGDTYSAYVNGSLTPATTLTTSLFSTGHVGLYDFSNQTFDNFDLQAVPEPTTMAALGLGVLLGLRRKREA